MCLSMNEYGGHTVVSGDIEYAVDDRRRFAVEGFLNGNIRFHDFIFVFLPVQVRFVGN